MLSSGSLEDLGESRKPWGITRAAGETRNKRAAKAGQKLLRDYETRRDSIRACYERYFLQETES